MDIKPYHNYWGWGSYTVATVVDLAVCTIAVSTSSWMEVTLTTSPSGKYCTLLSQHRGTMSSGLISHDLCFGNSECTGMMIFIATLGYFYVGLKIIAVVLSVMALKTSFNSSQIRVQAVLQLSTFILSIAVVVMFGTYISNFMGLQYVDWSCSAWSFYLFCAGACIGLLSVIGLGIAYSKTVYRDHPPSPIPPKPVVKKDPPKSAANTPLVSKKARLLPQVHTHRPANSSPHKTAYY
jgi:hypothetical protein